jgi:hypothetical protein
MEGDANSDAGQNNTNTGNSGDGDAGDTGILNGGKDADGAGKAAGDKDANADLLTGDDGQGKDGDDTNTDDADKQGAPESYEAFTMPEGMEADEALIEGVSPLFKKHNLSQEAAQEFIDTYNTKIQADIAADQTASADMITGWKNELMNDAEFGGAKFDENAAIANKAIKEFGSPAFVQMLQATGISNHPEMVKFAHKVGALISEDGFHKGPADKAVGKSDAEILYGKDGKSGGKSN